LHASSSAGSNGAVGSTVASRGCVPPGHQPTLAAPAVVPQGDASSRSLPAAASPARSDPGAARQTQARLLARAPWFRQPTSARQPRREPLRAAHCCSAAVGGPGPTAIPAGRDRLASASARTASLRALDGAAGCNRAVCCNRAGQAVQPASGPLASDLSSRVASWPRSGGLAPAHAATARSLVCCSSLANGQGAARASSVGRPPGLVTRAGYRAGQGSGANRPAPPGLRPAAAGRGALKVGSLENGRPSPNLAGRSASARPTGQVEGAPSSRASGLGRPPRRRPKAAGWPKRCCSSVACWDSWRPSA